MLVQCRAVDSCPDAKVAVNMYQCRCAQQIFVPSPSSTNVTASTNDLAPQNNFEHLVLTLPLSRYGMTRALRRNELYFYGFALRSF